MDGERVAGFLDGRPDRVVVAAQHAVAVWVAVDDRADEAGTAHHPLELAQCLVDAPVG